MTALQTTFPVNSISVQQLECIRGYQSLFSSLDFELHNGQALQVIGPNGCGKTSLLRILSGLTQAAEGQVMWNQQPVKVAFADYLAQLAYLGHRSGLKGDLNPVENLYSLLHLGIDVSRDIDQRIKSTLSSMGLGHRLSLPCRQLSAGQKQRVAVTRVSLQEVPLWILDEPGTSLDRDGVEYLGQIMAQHLARGGLIIFVSHQDFDLPVDSCRKLQLDQFHG